MYKIYIENNRRMGTFELLFCSIDEEMDSVLCLSFAMQHRWRYTMSSWFILSYCRQESAQVENFIALWW